MPKKVKDDSDSDKKPKKKTKAKKKTTKKKDKGITINLNVGSTGGNNKKSRKGGKGGFGGGVKNNRGFFSYASKDKNTNKYNTTEPANIKPLAYNSNLVSGHLDKNDAKDIEKLQNKLTIQDNNIIKGVESLKNLQNQLIQIENSPKKEVVYIQSPYNNNVPASAIKEEKKRGRPKKGYTVVLPKEKGNGQVGRPKGSKNKPKPKTNDDNYQDIVIEPLNIASVIKEETKKEGKKRGPKPKNTTTEPKQNLSVKFKSVIDPVKIPTQTDTPLFNKNPEPLLKSDDNNENDINEVIGKTSKPRTSKGVVFTKSKKTKSIITYEKVNQFIDEGKVDELINEYTLNRNMVKLLMGPRQKTKLKDYLYEVINNPETPADEINIIQDVKSPYDQGLNLPSTIKKSQRENRENLSVTDSANPFKKDIEDFDRLINQNQTLENRGLNNLSGGSLDDSLVDDDRQV